MIEEFIEMYGYQLPQFDQPPDLDFVKVNADIPLVNISLCCKDSLGEDHVTDLPVERPFMLLGVRTTLYALTCFIIPLL